MRFDRVVPAALDHCASVAAAGISGDWHQLDAPYRYCRVFQSTDQSHDSQVKNPVDLRNAIFQSTSWNNLLVLTNPRSSLHPDEARGPVLETAPVYLQSC